MVHKLTEIFVFLVKQVPGRGPEQRESGKTVLYLPIIIIIILIYYYIKLLIKMRIIPAETGNGTLLIMFWLLIVGAACSPILLENGWVDYVPFLYARLFSIQGANPIKLFTAVIYRFL